MLATYIESMGNGCRVDSLEVLTMSPPPAARSSAMAARDVYTGPRRLVAICRSMSPSLRSSTGQGR